MIYVTFKTRGKSGRVWEAKFDCGSASENALAAVTVAWKMYATIVGSRPA